MNSSTVQQTKWSQPMPDDIVARLRDMNSIRSMAATFAHHDNNWIKMLTKALEEVERIRAERDEARRTVCAITAERDSEDHISISPEHVAQEHGWDCFENQQQEDEE